MPRTQPSSAYQPSFVPAFQPNSDGVIVNNSAQSAMIMGFQRLIMEQGDGKKRADEIHHMRRRQGKVDRYNKAADGPDKIRTEKFVAKLPTIASPQPIYSVLYGSDTVAEDRAQQARDFEGSFLDKSKVKWNMVYEEIDVALMETYNRKKSLSFVQKYTWSSRKKTDYFYESLRESVTYLDEYFAKNDAPLRIKWREIQVKHNHLRVDLFFVYPNTLSQYESGFRTWMGSEDVTTF